MCIRDSDESVTRFEAKNSRSPLSLIGAVASVLDEDSLDLERLNALVDVDAFVKFWAAESVLGFWDGYCNDQNNFFIYVDPQESRLFFMPWGMDCAFQENMPLPPFFIRPQFVYTRGRLANRLYRNEVVREKYHRQVEQLLKEHWDEEDLLARVDAIEALGEPFNTRGSSYSKSLRNVRRFIKSRRQKLTAEMEKGFELKKPARECPYSAVVVEASGTFQAEWHDRVPEKEELGKPDLTLRVRGKEVEFRPVSYTHLTLPTICSV